MKIVAAFFMPRDVFVTQQTLNFHLLHLYLVVLLLLLGFIF